jgi:lipopolysaccharide export system protein LptC
MRLPFSNLLPLLTVLLLAVLTFWLRVTVEQGSPERSAVARHDPDAVVDNFRLVRLGPTGAPLYSISARRMLHYLDDNTSVLVQPQFHKRGADGVQLFVASNSARMSPDASEARFEGNVLLRREARQRPPLVARTEFLHVMADSDLVRSDRRVTLSEGGTMLTGVGMEMNRATRQIVLHSEVRGTFNVAKRD